MADNVAITAGSGTTIAADDISGALHQRVKLTWGVDGAAVDASATNPLPVTLSNVNANGQATSANSAPTVGASDWVPNMPKALAGSNGLTASRILSAATTNATSVKASAGKFVTLDVFNMAAYDVFLKFYDKASAPTVGTDTPVWTVPLKAGTGYSNQFLVGKYFATGIAYAITKLQADSDTTAVAASDVTGAMGWV